MRQSENSIFSIIISGVPEILLLLEPDNSLGVNPTFATDLVVLFSKSFLGKPVKKFCGDSQNN